MPHGLDNTVGLSRVLWMRTTCGATNSRLPMGKGEGGASAIGLSWMRLGSVTHCAQGR